MRRLLSFETVRSRSMTGGLYLTSAKLIIISSKSIETKTGFLGMSMMFKQ